VERKRMGPPRRRPEADHGQPAGHSVRQQRFRRDLDGLPLTASLATMEASMKHARQTTSPFPWLVLAASLMLPAGMACAQATGSEPAKPQSGATAAAGAASEPTSGAHIPSSTEPSRARQQLTPSDRTPLVSNPPPSPSPAPASAWTQLPGAANDIGAGGEVWVVGANRMPGGYGIWRWDGRQWQSVAGGGMRLDVGARGDAWLVDEAGRVLSWRAGRWVPVPGGSASDIGVGADGSLWIVGTTTVPGGKNIARWSGSRWEA